MTHIIILAAGKGTRMKSDLPKVLHQVKGTPIIQRLLTNIQPVCETPTLIVGHKAEDVISTTGNKYHYVIQTEQRGTGHAVMMAKEDLEGKDYKTVVVLLGDHPLVSARTVQDLVITHEKEGAAVTLATAVVPNYEDKHSVFLNYGRVIRDTDGTVHKIVEFKDASEEERMLKEVNPSYYCFDAKWLWENISKLGSMNASNEFYLTDMIQLARDQDRKVVASVIENIDECLGINTPEQLKMVEDTLVE